MLERGAPASSYRFPPFKEASDADHREFIQRKLDEADRNSSRVAELMGLERSHLYRRMRGRASTFADSSLKFLRVVLRDASGGV